MTLVRKNLMNIKYYSPYCGNTNCITSPRTEFNGSQFVCKSCGWISSFDEKFIDEYKNKWRIK